MTIESLRKEVFRIEDDQSFHNVALDVFHYQLQNNCLYADYCRHLGVVAKMVKSVDQVPFLPISFFRTHKVMSGLSNAALVFRSSATTSTLSSQHYLADPDIYIESFTRAFGHFYGSADEYCILALLPSYLERKDSSLVFMTDHLIKKSKHPLSGFYLDDVKELAGKLAELRITGQKTILIGVTFALLDLAETFPVNFPGLIVIETGGMKGRRKEIVRHELHEKLKKGFGVHLIHSEYGMTEMLTQAYSTGDGIFRCPPWMQVLIRDSNDPLSLVDSGITGGINVIDLANLLSCAFIATQDLGKRNADGSFEVLGRFDNSDVRGCNLMVASL
jgi:hypothetical protein